MIRFDAKVQAAGKQLIVRFPDAASKRLSSRGQVAVRGTLNGKTFETVVEPDGEFGHWIRIDRTLRKHIDGDKVSVAIEPATSWPEPSVPADLRRALTDAEPSVRDLWKTITPMARWEWVRWVNETKNPATRAKRVEVTISKLGGGKRRPCCFNLASCTDPEVSKSGKLVVD